MEKTKLYSRWAQMVKQSNHYPGVNPAWKKSYEHFHKWSHKNGYKPEFFLTRIDTKKGFVPSNLKWSEVRGKRFKNENLVFNPWGLGEMSLTAAAKKYGICSKTTIRKRVIEQGWDIEKALTTPGSK